MVTWSVGATLLLVPFVCHHHWVQKFLSQASFNTWSYTSSWLPEDLPRLCVSHWFPFQLTNHNRIPRVIGDKGWSGRFVSWTTATGGRANEATVRFVSSSLAVRTSLMIITITHQQNKVETLVTFSQMSGLSTPRLRVCHYATSSSWGKYSPEVRSSVYVAAMLKSQTIWFMAVGRDRDHRRCQLLSRQPTPLAPLPSLPGTQHRAKPPAPSRRMWGICSHICSPLYTFSPP